MSGLWFTLWVNGCISMFYSLLSLKRMIILCFSPFFLRNCRCFVTALHPCNLWYTRGLYLVIFLQNFACISMICSAILPLDLSVYFLPSAFEIQLAARFKIQILLQNSNLTSIVFVHGAEWVRLESFNYLLPRYKTSMQNKRGDRERVEW